eukprot:CAMPEP_0173156056 /NCGR_PEP_ID=MMETSP1105-20130129/14518_1 /TAXON_ID=2985 /ORGANISM="Ochromonas sp., Strain BG-1" /LENGTH=363 /DNA_ID=CAMNT_0014072689 /DNA_START=25 /DNA_END=1113 /DNA_ORIENTATION=+
MQIIVLWEGYEDPIVVDVPEDADINLFAQLVMVEARRSVQGHYFEVEGVRLGLNQPLLYQGVVDGSTVFVKKVTDVPASPAPAASRPVASPAPVTTSLPTPTRPVESQATIGSSSNVSLYDLPANITPDQLLLLSQQNPRLLQQIQSNDEELGGVLASQDIVKVRTLMMKRFMNRHKQEYQRQQDLMELERNPMNPELQKKIEEEIQLKNIQANMELALENLPEAFGRVTMLYVNIEVNNHPVKAFVDSGAQSTIMSMQCAERCNITRLIDKRFAGQARGVGTANIIGRIHIAQMKFGNSFFPISITVLENNDVDFLFGLDTLRRYRCCIDLEKNILRIEGASGKEEIPFLPESELPENARGT